MQTKMQAPMRFGVTLIVALLASAPAFGGVIDDRLSLPAALSRFLLAFTALWAVGALLTLIVRVPGSPGTDR
jgi:UDP-N-acetylmuramyl pentapeptide phosphotransferase/UDP-N-acetylglucosamine-1-phosphate transferase